MFICTLLDNSVKLVSSIHWESACLSFVEANWILLDCESNYISSNARLEFCCWCIVKLFTASNNLLAYDWFYEGAGSFYYQPITPFFRFCTGSFSRFLTPCDFQFLSCSHCVCVPFLCVYLLVEYMVLSVCLFMWVYILEGVFKPFNHNCIILLIKLNQHV